MFVRGINVVTEDKSAYFTLRGKIELTPEKRPQWSVWWQDPWARTMPAGQSDLVSPRLVSFCGKQDAALPVSPWEPMENEVWTHFESHAVVCQRNMLVDYSKIHMEWEV